MQHLHQMIVCAAILCASCQTKAGTGALAGGGIGATAGALITHSPSGALIGGAIGATSGAIIGASLDASDRDAMEKQNRDTLKRIDQREPLSIEDIKEMSKAGLKDKVIIDQIHATESTYSLTKDQILDLQTSGVSEPVIDAMIETGNS